MHPSHDGAGGRKRTRPRRDARDLRFFVLVWVLLSVAAAAWSFTTPLFASPDEDAQVVKAVAVAHGQFTGETIAQPHEYFPIITGVEVPAYYSTARSTTDCFIWDTLQPADCGPGFRASDDSFDQVRTWFGRYPPLYYAVVGLPSRFLDGEAAVLAMRTVGAVLCAGLLAVGFTALRGTPRPTPLLGAGLVAVTPTALFFSGMVNPTGLEIAAGFATWSILLPLVLEPAAHRVGPRLLAGAATATVLVNTRPGSALMALLIAVPLALVATRDFWLEAMRGRRWRLPVGLAVAGGLVALVWLLVEDPTATFGGNPEPDLASPVAAFTAGFARTGSYLEEQVALFGWLNLPVHPVVLTLLGAALAGLVVLALVLGRGRLRWAVALAAALVVLVPVVSQIPSAARLGLIWQGRYGLPFSIGLPLLAMAALMQETRRRLPAVAGPVLAAVAVAGHVGAFAWSAWRYAYGFGGSPLAGSPSWEPPGGLVLWLALFVVAISALGAVLVLQEDSLLRRLLPSVRSRPDEGAVAPTTPGAALS